MTKKLAPRRRRPRTPATGTENAVQIIKALAPVMATFFSALVLIMQFYMSNRAVRTDENVSRIEANTNHLASELVKVTGTAENAKGNLEGRAELKDEQKAKTKP